MAKKKYDLAVKAGEYTDGQGNKKNRWVNLGIEMSNDEGGTFIMLDPTINLAALMRYQKGDMVLVSKFDPDKKGNGKTAERTEHVPAAPTAAATTIPNDDFPF